MNMLRAAGQTPRWPLIENSLVDQSNCVSLVADFCSATKFGERKMESLVHTSLYVRTHAHMHRYICVMCVWVGGWVYTLLRHLPDMEAFSPAVLANVPSTDHVEVRTQVFFPNNIERNVDMAGQEVCAVSVSVLYVWCL